MKGKSLIIAGVLLSVSGLAIGQCNPHYQYDVTKHSIEVLDAKGNMLSDSNFMAADTTVAKAQAFTKQLQKLVAKKETKAIAALVRYPLRVNHSGKSTQVKSAKQFVSQYDKIFTPKITKAVTDQCLKGLFANSQGVMIGNGQVWFDSDGKGKLQVITVNQ